MSCRPGHSVGGSNHFVFWLERKVASARPAEERELAGTLTKMWVTPVGCTLLGAGPALLFLLFLKGKGPEGPTLSWNASNAPTYSLSLAITWSPGDRNSSRITCKVADPLAKARANLAR